MLDHQSSKRCLLSACCFFDIPGCFFSRVLTQYCMWRFESYHRLFADRDTILFDSSMGFLLAIRSGVPLSDAYATDHACIISTLSVFNAVGDRPTYHTPPSSFTFFPQHQHLAVQFICKQGRGRRRNSSLSESVPRLGGYK